jgi:hypothetical protein
VYFFFLIHVAGKIDYPGYDSDNRRPDRHPKMAASSLNVDDTVTLKRFEEIKLVYGENRGSDCHENRHDVFNALHHEPPALMKVETCLYQTADYTCCQGQKRINLGEIVLACREN